MVPVFHPAYSQHMTSEAEVLAGRLMAREAAKSVRQVFRPVVSNFDRIETAAKRRAKVANLMKKGMRCKEIADALGESHSTISADMSHARAKNPKLPNRLAEREARTSKRRQAVKSLLSKAEMTPKEVSVELGEPVETIRRDFRWLARGEA